MFVSVIVPVYNAEKLLKRSIESVLAQTDPDWELLLMDDGSTDGSAAVCESYAQKDSRIRVLHDSNHGVSYARNRGIDAATGDYLYFLDADDYLAPEAFARLRECVKDRIPDIVFTAFYKVYKTKTELVPVCLHAGSFDPYHTRLLGTVWGKLYRRAFVGDARFDPKLHLCEDAELNYRLLPKAQTVLPCDYPSYYYVYYAGSSVRGYRPERLTQYREALAQIHSISTMENAMVRSVTAFTCNVFAVVVMNNVFSSGNPMKLGQKLDLLRTVCEELPFREALAQADSSCISKQQYILIQLCRSRLYMGVWLLSLANRIRNRLLNH